MRSGAKNFHLATKARAGIKSSKPSATSPPANAPLNATSSTKPLEPPRKVPVKMWEYYLQLTEIEQAFKELKDDLSIFPTHRPRQSATTG
jgi:hypothetical protein